VFLALTSQLLRIRASAAALVRNSARDTMTDWAEDQLTLLRPRYPQWDLWIVRKSAGGIVWCAKPAGSPTATISTDSPESLIAEIAEQEAAL
jgi:hypothetical protein